MGRPDPRRGARSGPSQSRRLYEIGLGLDLENLETLGNEAYAALYQEKLAEWHEVYPIGPDSRFWRDGAPRVQSIGDARAVA